MSPRDIAGNADEEKEDQPRYHMKPVDSNLGISVNVFLCVVFVHTLYNYACVKNCAFIFQNVQITD